MQFKVWIEDPAGEPQEAVLSREQAMKLIRSRDDQLPDEVIARRLRWRLFIAANTAGVDLSDL